MGGSKGICKFMKNNNYSKEKIANVVRVITMVELHQKYYPGYEKMTGHNWPLTSHSKKYFINDNVINQYTRLDDLLSAWLPEAGYSSYKFIDMMCELSSYLKWVHDLEECIKQFRGCCCFPELSTNDFAKLGEKELKCKLWLDISLL